MLHLYLPVMIAIGAFCLYVAYARRKARAGGGTKQSLWVVGTGLLLVCVASLLIGFLLHR